VVAYINIDRCQVIKGSITSISISNIIGYRIEYILIFYKEPYQVIQRPGAKFHLGPQLAY